MLGDPQGLEKGAGPGAGLGPSRSRVPTLFRKTGWAAEEPGEHQGQALG